jgi:NitT/TauT family transport system substrate-binding protein
MAVYKKNRHLFFGAALAALCWSSTASADAYKLGLVEWFAWGTAYVAAEKGFWKAENLDIEIKQFTDYETEHLKAFENGHIDFTLAMAGSAVEMINRKQDYVILYEMDWSHGGDMFILSKDLQSVDQLKGKTIGAYSRSAPVTFFASKILASANLTLQDITLVEVANTKDLNDAFRKNRFPAIINFDPEASKVVQEGVGKALFSSASFPGVIPEVVCVQKKMLQQKPEDARKFLRGWMRALQWQANPANQKEFYAILQNTMFKGAGYSEADLDGFKLGTKIHADLDTIRERNTQGINTHIGELLEHLRQKGTPIGLADPAAYLQADMALEEAAKIFTK